VPRTVKSRVLRRAGHTMRARRGMAAKRQRAPAGKPRLRGECRDARQDTCRGTCQRAAG
jgi:hypothetical protein